MELHFGECSPTVMNRPDGSAQIHASPRHYLPRMSALVDSSSMQCPELSSSSFLDIVTSVTVVLGDE